MKMDQTEGEIDEVRPGIHCSVNEIGETEIRCICHLQSEIWLVIGPRVYTIR